MPQAAQNSSAFRPLETRSEEIDVEKERRRIRKEKEIIHFFHCPLLRWSLGFTGLTVVCVIIAIYGSLHADYVPTKRQQKHGFFAEYGSDKYLCKGSPIPQPKHTHNDGLLFESHHDSRLQHVMNLTSGGLPSILHLVDKNVIGNIFMRCALVIPLPVRVFQAYCMRRLLLSETTKGMLSTLMTDLMPTLVFLDTMALSMTVTVTTHLDHSEIYLCGLVIFFASACVNIIITISATFQYLLQSDKKWDTFSLLAKLSSGGLFVYMAPQFLQYHKKHVTFPICNVYVPSSFAYLEYMCLIAYIIFHLTQLIDVRNLNLQMGYPLYAQPASKNHYDYNITNFDGIQRFTVGKDRASGDFEKEWKVYLEILPELNKLEQANKNMKY